MTPSSSSFASSPFETGGYDPEPTREWIRGGVTLIASLVFVVVIVVYLREASLATDTTWPRIKDAMQAILPSVTSVLGTALGFYFGSQKR